ncbi:MAG: protein-L-isoaspartate O-methyltransferase family protein [Aestuariivirga sp.]|uniref:protein-L-isoaspartate O-methyltransferase family protein n=1 Tax=Aestuariivirga sp. TaxID=2650926 RepID=UPI0038D12D42
MTDFTAARLNMVDSQVRPNGITDRRILAAMQDIPREQFVPERFRAIAYVDEDVPLAPAENKHGPRALIEAMAFARLLQNAEIKPGDRVLVVGAGTGYGAAVLSRIAADVVALESDPGLAREARHRLAGLKNVRIVEGPLPAGAETLQPFDVIILEGRAEEVPQPLFDQLAEGGRLVAVVGEADLARAKVFTRTGHAMAARDAFDASVTALPGFRKNKSAFVF